MARRRLPEWASITGWAVLGTTAAGLPTALAVAGLDAVRRSESAVAQRVVLGALLVLAIGVVVAAERGLSWAAREQGIRAALGYLGAAVALVGVGVLVPVVGLVLVAVLVVLAVPLALAGIAYLAYWRWQHGPTTPSRTPTGLDEVRARAAARRKIVRARHDRTREAVARGYVGPGFTRGR